MSVSIQQDTINTFSCSTQWPTKSVKETSNLNSKVCVPGARWYCIYICKHTTALVMIKSLFLSINGETLIWLDPQLQLAYNETLEINVMGLILVICITKCVRNICFSDPEINIDVSTNQTFCCVSGSVGTPSFKFRLETESGDKRELSTYLIAEFSDRFCVYTGRVNVTDNCQLICQIADRFGHYKARKSDFSPGKYLA